MKLAQRLSIGVFPSFAFLALTLSQAFAAGPGPTPVACKDVQRGQALGMSVGKYALRLHQEMLTAGPEEEKSIELRIDALPQGAHPEFAGDRWKRYGVEVELLPKDSMRDGAANVGSEAAADFLKVSGPRRAVVAALSALMQGPLKDKYKNTRVISEKSVTVPKDKRRKRSPEDKDHNMYPQAMTVAHFVGRKVRAGLDEIRDVTSDRYMWKGKPFLILTSDQEAYAAVIDGTYFLNDPTTAMKNFALELDDRLEEPLSEPNLKILNAFGQQGFSAPRFKIEQLSNLTEVKHTSRYNLINDFVKQGQIVLLYSEPSFHQGPLILFSMKGFGKVRFEKGDRQRIRRGKGSAVDPRQTTGFGEEAADDDELDEIPPVGQLALEAEPLGEPREPDRSEVVQSVQKPARYNDVFNYGGLAQISAGNTKAMEAIAALENEAWKNDFQAFVSENSVGAPQRPTSHGNRKMLVFFKDGFPPIFVAFFESPIEREDGGRDFRITFLSSANVEVGFPFYWNRRSQMLGLNERSYEFKYLARTDRQSCNSFSSSPKNIAKLRDITGLSLTDLREFFRHSEEQTLASEDSGAFSRVQNTLGGEFLMSLQTIGKARNVILRFRIPEIQEVPGRLELLDVQHGNTGNTGNTGQTKANEAASAAATRIPDPPTPVELNALASQGAPEPAPAEDQTTRFLKLLPELPPENRPTIELPGNPLGRFLKITDSGTETAFIEFLRANLWTAQPWNGGEKQLVYRIGGRLIWFRFTIEESATATKIKIADMKYSKSSRTSYFQQLADKTYEIQPFLYELPASANLPPSLAESLGIQVHGNLGVWIVGLPLVMVVKGENYPLKILNELLQQTGQLERVSGSILKTQQFLTVEGYPRVQLYFEAKDGKLFFLGFGAPQG
ncbi:MAG: hypothetical protein C5B49_06465 [Bdellovibrio sp.]|nr:MAG: hypothetical protein C5B49_06465 [Bdellovibrio sp.]